MTVSTEIMSVKQREVVFSDMDEVTQEAAKDGVQKLQAGCQVALLISYDLGAIVNRIFTAEHLNEAQQKQEVKKLAAYWNQPSLGPTTLYDLRNVADAFERNFIKEQSEERLSNGGYLSWSHFKELQKVSTEKRQLTLLKQIRRHSWSANELAFELQGKKDADVKRSGGRKPALPKTPNAMLQKLFASIQQSDNYVQAVSEPLGGIFMEMPAGDVDEQFVENIENALTRMGEAGTHLKDTEKKLKAVQKRAVSMLKKSAAEAEKASPEAEKAGAASNGSVTGKKKKAKPVTSAAKKAAGKGKTSGPQASGKKKRGTPRRSGAANAAPAEADGILA
jgi:hypothetical protein